MDAEALKSKLENRGKACLHNQAEITENALNAAMFETIDFIGQRQAREFAVMDFAFIRLKIYLKIMLTEEDELLLREAIKEISAAPVLDAEGNTQYLTGVVEAGKSVWEN
jgi:hypothetical protein